MRTLLLGGARSGKSSLAARWAAERSKSVCCVVTATVTDDEMAARIEAHRRERPEHWRVHEEPRQLSAAVREESRAGGLLLVDCLTLWTANCLWPPEKIGVSLRAVDASQIGPAAQEAGASPTTAARTTPDLQADITGWHAERDAFLTSVLTTPTEIIIVSNEVGTSLVPENAAARLFRDEQGRLNQLVAGVCDAVYLVTAGLPLRLK
jgi:adenosylcobinamide kinase / adenosylcobinamide-phosphate guanylyltransferase